MHSARWKIPAFACIRFGLAAVLYIAVASGEGIMAADKIEVLNKGIGGNSTRDGLNRFQSDVIGMKPNHLVLYFGMNDALNSGKLVPPEEFRGNLQKMIDRAREAGIQSLILVTPNPIVGSYVSKRHPTHPREDLEQWLSTYDRVIRDLAESNGIPLADLRKRVLDYCSDLESSRSLIRNAANCGAADGVHLTAEGYHVMGELIAETLEGKVKPGECVVCFGDSITYGANMKGAGTSTGDTYPARLNRILNP